MANLQQTFIFDYHGDIKQLHIGQKVRCIYYHEYPGERDAYKRSKLSLLIDKPFKPVKLGVIVGDAGIHPYWLAKDRKEQYLFVNFKEYILPKPIPISCIGDALEEAEKTKRFLELSKHRIGEKGYSKEAFDSLTEGMNDAFSFVNKPTKPH